MGSILKYRIPGKAIVAQSGRFFPVTSLERYVGFVLTSFDKSMRFGFEANDSEGGCFYSGIFPEVYDKSVYLEKGNKLVDLLNSDIADKAILSRVMKREGRIVPGKLFDVLCEEYPSAFVYLVSDAHFGTWIGASPELLMHYESGIGNTVALAGTKRAGDNASWGQKEIEEQQYVSDFISEQLEHVDAIIEEETEARPVVSGPVQHLRTDFRFKLDEHGVIELVERLHPTPAVSGVPRDKAIEIINDLEDHERSLYAGIVGVIGNETNLFVNLRCAQLFENESFLYLGGGYTKDSIPEKEWDETENKAKTLLNIIEKL